VRRPAEIRQARPEAQDSPSPGSGDAEPGFLTLQDLFRVFKRRRVMIVSIAALVLSVTLVQLITATPTFRSNASVYVNPFELRATPRGLDSVDDPGFDLSPYVSILRGAGLFEEVAGRLELAQNRDFRTDVSKGLVVDSLRRLKRGLRRSASPREDEQEIATLHRRFLRTLEIETAPESGTITLRYSSVSPATAGVILRTVIDVFIERSDEVNRSRAAHAGERLRAQLEVQREAVATVEQALLDYAAEHGLDVAEASLPQTRELDSLMRELAGSRADVVEAQVRELAARGATADELPPELITPTIRELQRKLSDLRTQHAVVSENFGPKWPQAKQLGLEVAEVESQLERTINQAIESAKEEHAYALARHERLGDALRSMRKDTTAARRELIEFGILANHVEAEKALYTDLMQQRQRARLAALDPSSVRIVASPSHPDLPSPPRPIQVLALGLLMAIGSGLGVALVLELASGQVFSEGDIEQLTGLPVLARIPKMAAARSRRRSERAKNSAQALIPMSEGTVSGITQAVAREAYRTLHASLQHGESAGNSRVILVTSSGPDEGKTTTSLNLAIAIAETSARTLLVDLDLRNGGVDEHLGVKSEASAETFLAGKASLAETISPSRYPNLSVIASGAPAANAFALLESGPLTAMIRELRDQYDFVVMDTPPVLGVADAIVVAGHADVVLMVARCRRTVKSALQRACAALTSSGARIGGVVLNEVRRTDLDHYDIYAYEHYHHNRTAELRQKSRRVEEGRSVKLNRARSR
jgi:succinoglycan biosynthesis transport protein ExoP